jgi:protein-S-isoprenylcysteine O-methyltransferase Ste14
MNNILGKSASKKSCNLVLISVTVYLFSLLFSMCYEKDIIFGIGSIILGLALIGGLWQKKDIPYNICVVIYGLTPIVFGIKIIGLHW